MLGFKPSLPPPERPLDRPGLSDWTDAYDNSGHIPDAAAYLELWPREAAAFRDAMGPRARLDLPYPGGLNDGARERLDLFLPETDAKGLAVGAATLSPRAPSPTRGLDGLMASREGGGEPEGERPTNL